MDPIIAGPDKQKIAAVAHEANRAYRALIGEEPGPPWAEVDDDTRKSALDGVDAVIGGATTDAHQQHEQWCRQKRAAGWMWGPKKSLAHKTHPCLMAWDALPTEQKVKDHLFRHVIQAFLEPA